MSDKCPINVRNYLLFKTNTRRPHPEQNYKKMSFTSAIRFCFCN